MSSLTSLRGLTIQGRGDTVPGMTSVTDLEILLVSRCSAGHEQVLRVRGMSLEWAKQWAGLMDGTSPLYVRPPTEDEQTAIGRCLMPANHPRGLAEQLCRARVRCEVRVGKAATAPRPRGEGP